MSFLGSSYIMYPLLFVIIFILCYLWSDKVFSWFFNKSTGQKEEISKYLELMFVEIDEQKLNISLMLASVGLGGLFFILFWPNLVLGFFFGTLFMVLGWTLPKHIFKFLYERRCSAFVDQMVDATTVLANGVKAGLSVTQSMERVANNQPNPISQEFRLVLSQNQLGQSIEDALNELGDRIPKPDVQMFVTSVNILKETGGNMAETFQTINYTIRERQKIEKKIEAMTAQGIMQGVIISCVPFVLLGMFYAIDPNYISPLFTTTLGWIILFVALVLIIIGAFMIRKIVNIKV